MRRISKKLNVVSAIAMALLLAAVLAGVPAARGSENSTNQSRVQVPMDVMLLISDGLDASRGFDSGSVLQSIDLDRAIREARERNVTVYAFYAPSTGLTSRSRLASSWGQSSLSRLANETGGKAFFQGTSFVSFASHFDRLIRELNRPYHLEP